MKCELLNNINKVFFVGIGGISMSALSKLTHNNNIKIGGSDVVKTNLTESLKSFATIFYGHNKSNIIKFKPNLVVYSGAVNDNNPELLCAKQLNIPMVERSEFLGAICNNYKNVIAISGTHGKTTTTAMIAEIFKTAGLNPTVHIGGEVVNFNGNVLLGGNEFFITEACEYKKSFEHIKSTCAVVTNVEPDHMDCYFNFNDLLNSFKKFVDNSNFYVCDANCVLNKKVNNKYAYFVGNNANFEAKNLINNSGKFSYDVYEGGMFLTNIKLNVLGEYNVKNSLYAVAVARLFNIDANNIYNGLKNFNGVKRRNELLTIKDNVCFYADYCHHPTEIKNSLQNFKNIYNNILCVFQPHTYSRTKNLINEFSTCFKGVNKLIIFKTYAAREKYLESGSETALFKCVKQKNKQLILNNDKLISQLKTDFKNYDCVLIFGAGDVYSIVKNNLNNVVN